MTASQLTLIVTRDDDDADVSISIETFGFDDGDVLEALMRTAEAVIQKQIKNELAFQKFVADMTDEHALAMAALHARLALLDLVTDLDLADTIGIAMEL